MSYPVEVMEANPKNTGLCRILPGLIFSHAGDHGVDMNLILPSDRTAPHPVLVFLQGSGWTKPDRTHKEAMFVDFARRGIAVAMITHRSTNEGFPAPAYLIDAKCAVRFLRANASRFCLDTERFFFGGSSSGGNTALLIGQTGDDPEYKSDEYATESDAVRAVISAAGPADLIRYFNINDKPDKLVYGRDAWTDRFCGKIDGAERVALLEKLSPELRFLKNPVLTPTLFIHGTVDASVPENESLSMYTALRDAGCEAAYVRVPGAGHGGALWSPWVYERMFSFLQANL